MRQRKGEGGERERGKNNLSPPLNVHHVSWLLLGFLFCLAASPALAVAASSVPWRQRGVHILPSHCLSASLSLFLILSLFLPPLCLPICLSVCRRAQCIQDLRFAALASDARQISPPVGLSWVTDSCLPL